MPFFPAFMVLCSQIFFFFGIKWQFALNMEEYEIAQQLRDKLTEVRY